MFQALPKAAPKILSTLPGQSKTLTTANLSPQQQRIVLQSFKQPVSATAATASQTTTRLIRTTPVTTTTSAGIGSSVSSGIATGAQGGQIITLDHLLQKATPGKLLTTGSNIIQLATSTASGNVITLTPGGQSQQQQQSLQQQQVHTAQMSAAAKSLPASARIVTSGHTTMVPKIIGKTTVVPGKPLLLHAKTLKLGTGNAVVSSQATVATSATTTLNTGGIKTTAQNIVIGGQTMKLHGAVRN